MPEGLILFIAGLLAGTIDAIAGGGGLITLPTLGLFYETGPHAIGTNKIAGTLASLAALIVYTRKQKPDWSSFALFAASTAGASWVGSQLSPLLPPEAFKIFLWITCPLVLLLVWRKDTWTKYAQSHPLPVPAGPGKVRTRRRAALILAGVLCGLYDGAWGPGGGTLMLLACLWVAKLPLLAALAASKLANTTSAGSALIGYSRQGYVHWESGLILGAGITLGATIGATHASKHAARVIRPVLTFVVILLLIRVGLS